MSQSIEFGRITGPAAIDMAGQKVAHWTVLTQARSRRSRAQWNCQCDCGAQRVIGGTSLRAMERHVIVCRVCGAGS